MSDHPNSDPLPFTQLDRAVKPRAATLSTMVGVTYQHALGSLAEFWEACGDPRELERLLRQGKDEVVLSREEVAGRLEIAFGRPVNVDSCRMLGLLEARPDGFRVRGMSRYFAPIRARLVAREKGSAGGKASAAARKERDGTAQPRSGASSTPAQAPAQAEPEAGPNPNAFRSEAVPKPPEASDIGHRSSLKTTSSTPVDGPAERVFAKYQTAAKSPTSKLDEKRRRLIQARLKDFSEEDLCRSLDGYARSPWHHGENERRTKYLKLTLWFRDSDHVEAGIAMSAGPPTTTPTPPVKTALDPYPENFS